MILAHPAGDERRQREPEQEMEVGPQHLAVDALGDVQHVMVVVPVDAEEHVAQHVGEERWRELPRGGQSDVVRHFQLQHHDRDDDGEHAVAEGLEPVLGHVRQCSGNEDVGSPERLALHDRLARRRIRGASLSGERSYNRHR